jgi:hypothetical protein
MPPSNVGTIIIECMGVISSRLGFRRNFLYVSPSYSRHKPYQRYSGDLKSDPPLWHGRIVPHQMQISCDISVEETEVPRQIDKSTDLPQVAGKLYCIMLYRGDFAMSGSRTHNFSGDRY